MRQKLRVTEDNIQTFKKYESTATTLIRGGWFFDYTSYLLEWYESDRNIDMSDLARETYSKTLAFRHPWIIRTPARWAMGLVNKRDKFNKLICEEQTKVFNRPY